MQFTTTILALLSVAFASAMAEPLAPTHIGIQCTTVITAQQQYGCTLTAAAAMATETIECNGCVISTTQIADGFFGHGPVCFGGRKTTTDTLATATMHECAVAGVAVAAATPTS